MEAKNIVILGKVGSGKKSLGNHICDTEIFRQKRGVLGTSNASIHYGESESGRIRYRILTVDTESSQTRYNDPIPHIKKKFKVVHSIIFVIAYGRYTDESHGSLSHVIQSLNERAGLISALAITHCDGLQDVQRASIIAEFQNNPRTLQLVSFMGKGVHTFGFPDTSVLPPNLKPIMQIGIDSDETRIKKLIEGCSSPLAVEGIPGQALKQQFVRPQAAAFHTGEPTGVPTGKQTQPVFRQQLYHPHDPHATSPFQSQLVSQNPPTANILGITQPEMGNLQEPHSTSVKTVIILGKVGSGKRTLGNHIAGEKLFNYESSGVATVTRDTGMFTGKFTKNGILYHIVTVDTESLGKSYNNPIPLIKQTVQHVNLIIFVIPYGCYTDESHGSLVHVLKNLRHEAATPISALVLTHCEGFTADMRRAIISEFRTNDSSARIAAFMGKSIHAVGFCDMTQSPPDVRSEIQKMIEKDEKTMIQLVEGCETSVSVSSLQAQVEFSYQRSSISPDQYGDRTVGCRQQ